MYSRYIPMCYFATLASFNLVVLFIAHLDETPVLFQLLLLMSYAHNIFTNCLYDDRLLHSYM